jgi:hypothetical protein
MPVRTFWSAVAIRDFTVAMLAAVKFFVTDESSLQ